MSEQTLQGRRILVVEDEYLLADELRQELEHLGADVLGPVATMKEATGLAKASADIDGAILDVNLGGEMVFPLADLLRERRIPIIFSTGYDASIIPERFSAVRRCGKPVECSFVVAALLGTDAISAEPGASLGLNSVHSDALTLVGP